MSNGAALGIAARRMADRGEDAGGAAIRARPHWIHFSGALGFALFVALVGTLLVRHNDLPRATDLRVVAWCLAIAVLGFVGPLLRWRRTLIEVGDGIARCSAGVFRPRSVSVDLGRARMANVEQSLLGRVFGYGQVRVVDADGVEHLFPPIGASANLTRALGPSDRRGSSRSG